jgi:NADH:ubiquinone reductase (H+-translocating)
MDMNIPQVDHPRVVIIGCGFGGMELAKQLANQSVQVVLIDKHNYHTFQPLLYQVSTAGLEADSIAYPIRKIFAGQPNLHYRWAEVLHIHIESNTIDTNIGSCTYDYLVIATGTTTNYYGISGLDTLSMPMKTVPEALNLRSLILQNLEKALTTTDSAIRDGLMTFAIVGGGPTGVELAGALCELKRHVLPHDYPELDMTRMRVLLVESGDTILQNMSSQHQSQAMTYLKELGAELSLNTRVTAYDGMIAQTASTDIIATANLIWAAGVKGVSMPGLPSEVILPNGRIKTDAINRVLGLKAIFALGDIACIVSELTPRGHPQVAPVAIQQGKLLASNIMAMIAGSITRDFVYGDQGSMATIGRNRAVAEIGRVHLSGIAGWMVWMLVHLMSIIGYRNRVVILINWIWNYINYDRNIRLIIRPFSPKT